VKQAPIEIANEPIGQELNRWFSNEECEALARKTGFIQRSTSRLTGSHFFNLLTVEILDEPTVSYEGLCDILEERDPDVRITPQALCARMNSAGAVEFLKASLARTLQETTRQPLAALEKSAWLAPFPRVLLANSTQMQIHEKMADDFKGSGGNASTAAIKVDYSYDAKNEQAEHIAIRRRRQRSGFCGGFGRTGSKGRLGDPGSGLFLFEFFCLSGFDRRVFPKPTQLQRQCLPDG
jgi:hypothetical protein